MNKPQTKLKGLVIGGGSIGARHLNNLKTLGFNDISICDTDRKKTNELSQKYKVKKFFDFESALLENFDFSIICTYPHSHIDISNICIKNNSHVFIEKPMSSDLRNVKLMLRKADSKKLKIAVGYNTRFDKGLIYLKNKLMKSSISTPLSISSQWGQHIKFWRPGDDYKNHYILKKGSGIILDASHEYDYVRWLLNDDVVSVYCQARKSSTIKTQTESIANIIMKFKRGTIYNLVIDYLRPQYERKCQIIGEKGDLKWEYVVKKMGWKNYNARANSNVTINFIHPQKSISKNFNVKLNDMYIDEMQDFTQSILDNKKPLVDGWEGFKTLKIGMAALESTKKNKIIRL